MRSSIVKRIWTLWNIDHNVTANAMLPLSRTLWGWRPDAAHPWNTRSRKVEMTHAQGAHDRFLAVDALAKNFRVLGLDLVGWGFDARLAQGYSFARLVNFVRELQDRLDLPTCGSGGCRPSTR